jgi:hypothetical protein
MRNNIVNRFRVDAGKADTDLVVGFPTKHFHVDTDQPGWNTTWLPPFVEPFGDDETTNDGVSRVTIGIKTYDREEDTFSKISICQDPFTGETFPAGAGGLCPSPTVIISDAVATLDYEVNVIEYGNGVFGSALTSASANNQVNQANFGSGWTRLSLTEDRDAGDNPLNWIVDDTGTVYAGLPVAGSSFLRLDNGNEGIEILRYGFSFDSGYTRAVSTATTMGR